MAGSVFWFEAPFPAVADEKPLGAGELAGLRVVLVDPSATGRAATSKYLTSWGIECVGVEGESQAAAVLRRATETGAPCDLLIVAVAQEPIGGAPVGAMLVESLRGPLPPVLILAPEPADARVAAEIDVAATLVKPYRQEALKAAIGGAFATPPSLAAPAAAVPSEPVSRGATVLVVEDNEINAIVAEALLRYAGIDVDLARDGREAVTMAMARRYEAIFMDCEMPGLDGFAATRQIRRDELDGHVSIIAMTALTMSGDRQRCLEAGMDDYLSKPLQRGELDRVIDRWVPNVVAATVVASATTVPYTDQELADRAGLSRIETASTVSMRI